MVIDSLPSSQGSVFRSPKAPQFGHTIRLQTKFLSRAHGARGDTELKAPNGVRKWSPNDGEVAITVLPEERAGEPKLEPPHNELPEHRVRGFAAAVATNVGGPPRDPRPSSAVAVASPIKYVGEIPSEHKRERPFTTKVVAAAASARNARPPTNPAVFAGELWRGNVK